ncbi:unnamed protein product, partial [Cladocopium goreaui]
MSRELERVSVNDLTPLLFLEHYAVANRPVVLLEAVQKWPCWRLWRDEDGQPKLAQMAEDFEKCDGPVVNCENDQQETWNVASFLRCLEQDQGCEHLYLKDWHFVQACKTAQTEVPYEAPDFLSAPLHDWLNDFKQQSKPEEDYRYCYVGAKGTRTKLHHDVLLSHSWSANICGRKKWIFYPPDCKDQLEIRPGHWPASAQPDCYDAKEFPEAKQAFERRIEVIQEPGELIFVPSGWYHEVENLTLAISINHNWLNASNVEEVWQFLHAEFERVKEKIDDVIDAFESEGEAAWIDHCNKLM